MGDRFLTTTEVANELRRTAATLRSWRHAGKGPRFHRVGGKALYAREDVEAFIASTRIEAS